MGKGSLLPKHKGKGRIDISRDYSRFTKSNRARNIQLALMFLPYVAMTGFLFLSVSKVLGIFVLLVPFALMWVFQTLDNGVE